MRIALFGYGRMGHEIEKIAAAAGHDCPVRVDPIADGATHLTATAEDLAPVDVCVDFSLGPSALGNIQTACAAGKPIVVGATAWEKDLEAARQEVARTDGALLWAPNFSIGVQTLFRLVREAARALDGLPGLDAAVIEAHHRGKADSPSGTAKRLAAILLEELAEKTTLATALDGAIAPEELQVVALRHGLEPGAHTVSFDLGEDVLELSHRARSRAVFARGAVRAAEWLVGRKGFYAFEDMLFGPQRQTGAEGP